MNSRKIICVDDCKTQLVFLQGVLESAGYEVFTSENIWISSKVMSLQPDMILMDVEVNGFNGADTVRFLKNGTRSKDILILLHSSQSPEVLEALCQHCKADGYISKDGNAETLLRHVDALFEERPALARV